MCVHNRAPQKRSRASNGRVLPITLQASNKYEFQSATAALAESAAMFPMAGLEFDQLDLAKFQVKYRMQGFFFKSGYMLPPGFGKDYFPFVGMCYSPSEPNNMGALGGGDEEEPPCREGLEFVAPQGTGGDPCCGATMP